MRVRDASDTSEGQIWIVGYKGGERSDESNFAERRVRADEKVGGVSDGARTRDIPDHNRVLYQLSYAHHV